MQSLEAKLNAKNERVQELLCELAALKAQPRPAAVFTDDGKDSWLQTLCVGPCFLLLSKVAGKTATRKVRRGTTLLVTQFAKNSGLTKIEYAIKQAGRVITQRRDGAVLLGLYVFVLHALLLRALIAW